MSMLWQSSIVVPSQTNAGVEFVEQHQRIVAAGDFELGCELDECRGLGGEFAGEEHFPVIAFADEMVEFLPCIGR